MPAIINEELKFLPILVIGAGSIGERHIGILQALGFKNIFVLRKRMLALRTIDPASITVLTSWEDILQKSFFAAIICTPTAHHVSQTEACLSAGMHVLVEKPIGHTPEEIPRLLEALNTEKPQHVQVAYMLRYHPFAKKVKEIINDRQFGALLYSHSYWGEYLPNWHPWEDYRASYAAKKELGGGAALTLSHDLDLMFWLNGGLPQKATTNKQYFSPLEVDVESAADIYCQFPGGATAHSHLNYFEKASRRYYRFVFEEASISFDYYESKLLIDQGEKKELIDYSDFVRNQMFTEQAVHFFQQTLQASTEQSRKNIVEAGYIVKTCQEE